MRHSEKIYCKASINTKKREQGVEYSYYWTSLGIDVLHHMGIIRLKETVDNLKSGLPGFID